MLTPAKKENWRYPSILEKNKALNTLIVINAAKV